MVALRKMEHDLFIHCLVNRRDIPMVIHCLKNGAVVDENILYTIHTDFDMLYTIITNYPNTIDISSGMIFTALCYNYRRNRPSIMYLLKNCRVPLGAGISMIMQEAVRDDDIDMVKFIDSKWDIALTTPFMLAAKECKFEIMKFLFSKGKFDKNTLDNALNQAISRNVQVLKKQENLKRVVAFLMKNGADKSSHLLKICIHDSMSMVQQDFTVLITLLSFYNLADVMMNIESYALHAMPIDILTLCVADAFKLQRATKKIVQSFKVRRRLILVRCIYQSYKALYSPALVFTIAKHGGL
jgi:hypothetical protein